MYSHKDKILSVEEAYDIIEGCKAMKQKIVFTNGCFDLLHYGHVDYLEKAKKLGDKLVVAINTDDSVKKLKGYERPIMKLESRASVIASLMYVDIVIFFSEPTPKTLIDILKPDILVKGGDYNEDEIVGYNSVIKNGGEVHTIPLVKSYSTTNIVNIIKNS